MPESPHDAVVLQKVKLHFELREECHAVASALQLQQQPVQDCHLAARLHHIFPWTCMYSLMSCALDAGSSNHQTTAILLPAPYCISQYQGVGVGARCQEHRCRYYASEIVKSTKRSRSGCLQDNRA